jgi:hypothetical protein
MANDELSQHLERLNALPPDAQSRVASALKSSIEAEVSASAKGGLGANPAAAFSRGILFSKSGALRNPDEMVLPALSEMDDAKFETFAKRLTDLRQMSGSGGNPIVGGGGGG